MECKLAQNEICARWIEQQSQANIEGRVDPGHPIDDHQWHLLSVGFVDAVHGQHLIIQLHNVLTADSI